MLVRIVWWNFHQVVASVWVNLDGVIPASRLIHDLPDCTDLSFDTLRRIELAEYRQQGSAGSAQRWRRIVDIRASHLSPKRIVTLLRPINIYAPVAKPFFVFGDRSGPGVFVPLGL